jgi:hypothetical protein
MIASDSIIVKIHTRSGSADASPNRREKQYRFNAPAKCRWATTDIQILPPTKNQIDGIMALKSHNEMANPVSIIYRLEQGDQALGSSLYYLCLENKWGCSVPHPCAFS